MKPNNQNSQNNPNKMPRFSLNWAYAIIIIVLAYLFWTGNRGTGSYNKEVSYSTFQTYVESLKNSGSFGKEEQAIAFDKAKAIITSELTEELKTFITQNYGDLQKWIANQVEATIYKLKN